LVRRSRPPAPFRGGALAPSRGRVATDREGTMTRRQEAAPGGRDAARIGRATVMAVAGCLLLGAGLAWLDRGSLERANHAFRQGDALEARAGYERIVSRRGDEVAAFNLGTALLPADPERAE